MTTRYTKFCAGEHYHVYNRGNNKQKIFISHSDYQRFFNTLKLVNTTENINVRNILRDHNDVQEIEIDNPLITIHAVCLMPNHFHLLVTPKSDDGLSKFMLKLGTSYSMYFNKKYDRTGGLFEGRYKAEHADNDEYLKYLFSYIHLNPVRDKSNDKWGSLDEAINYPYSTLSVYTNTSLPRAALGREQIIDKSLMQMYLPDKKHLRAELLDWIDYDSGDI